MSTHRANPVETLQEIVSSFKQFEKKIDKLQNDVNYQGHTLSELRVMVANISGGTMHDVKLDNLKGVSKTTAVDHYNFNESIKIKRKSAIQPLLHKSTTKNNQEQKYGTKLSKNSAIDRLKNMPSRAKNTVGCKRSVRQRKGDAPRKATSLQTKKLSGKKRSKSPKTYEFQNLV